MSSAFVTVAPTKRAPRSARRRRKDKETAKLAATTTTETTQSTNDAVASVTAQSSSTTSPGSSTTTSSPSTSQVTPAAPSKTAAAPSPKPASIWDKRKAARQTAPKSTPQTTAAVPPHTTSSSAAGPRKVPNIAAQPAPQKPVPSPPRSGLRSGKGFGARREVHKYDPSAAPTATPSRLPSRTAAQPKPDISSQEQFPSLGKRKKGGFQVNKSKAVAYNPNEVDMTRKPPPMDDRPVYSRDSRPAYGSQSSAPDLGGLSRRSSGGYRRIDGSPRRPSGASSGQTTSSLSKLTFGRGKNRYVPPTLRDSLQKAQQSEPEVKAKVARPPQPAASQRASPPKQQQIAQSQSTSPQTQQQRVSPQRPSPQKASPQRPSPQKGSPQRPSPQQRAPSNMSSERARQESRPRSPERPNNQRGGNERERVSMASGSGIGTGTGTGSGSGSSRSNAHLSSPQVTRHRDSGSDRKDGPSPAKSDKSARSSGSSDSKRSIKTKKKAISLHHGPTKKYLELRKGGIGSIKDVFLINNDDKKLHDVASVKKQLANTIAANDESASNDYPPHYYSQQDMVDYVVNSDFNSINDKSVSVSANKIKSTAEMWNPALGNPMPGAPAPAPGGVGMNPYAAQPLPGTAPPGTDTVYAQDGLPATNMPMVNAMNGVNGMNSNPAPSGPGGGPGPGPGVGPGMGPGVGPVGGAPSVPVSNAWNPATQFNPMGGGPANLLSAQGAGPSNAYDTSPTPTSPRNVASNVVPDPNARVPLSLQQPVQSQQAMNAMVPTHAPGQVLGGGGGVEPFPGMLPNVPLVTDPNEIKRNEAIASNSALSPTVNEFQPTPSAAMTSHLGGVQQPLNQQFQFGGNQMNAAGTNPYGPMVNQFAAQNVLVSHANANLQNQQWIQNQQQQQHHNMNGAGPHINGQGPPPPGPPPPGRQQGMNAMNGMNRPNEMGFQPHGLPQGPPPPQGPPQGHHGGPVHGGGGGGGFVPNNGPHSQRGPGPGPGPGPQGPSGPSGPPNNFNPNHQVRGGGGGRGYNQRGNYHRNGPRNRGMRGNWQHRGGRGNYANGGNHYRDDPRNRDTRPRGGGGGGGGYRNRGGQYAASSRDRRDDRNNRSYQFRERGGGRHGYNQRRNRPTPYQRAQAQKKQTEHQNALYRENIFQTQEEVTYDPNLLPEWVGKGSIDHYFGANEEMDGDDDNGLSKLYDPALYGRFLCDAASDGVFEYLGFKEVIFTVVPAASKKLYARIRDTAPVFRRLTLCDWVLDLGGGFVKHIGNGDVLSASGLFSYKNPKGLRSVSIKFSKSLNEWLASVPWKELREYLESNTKCLESVVLGDGSAPNGRKRGKGSDSEAARLALQDVDPTLIEPLKCMFYSFVTAPQFVVESAPFAVDTEFCKGLTRMITDLRLYDERTQWDETFLQEIKGYFGGLKRLGFPAGCLNIPALVSNVEGSVDELIIRNLDNKHRLSPQDLQMLFERFEAIEVDSSLVEVYPSTKNKAKLKALSVRADTHNFFIPLLLGVPSSVKTLTIKNATFSNNNLIIDLNQRPKFNTAGVETLVLEGFADNLKQIWKVLNNDFFPKLRNLVVHLMPTDRSYRDHRGKEEEISQYQRNSQRLRRIHISTVLRESIY